MTMNVIRKQQNNEKATRFSLTALLCIAVVILNVSNVLVQTINGMASEKSIIFLCMNTMFLVLFSCIPVNMIVNYSWAYYGVYVILLICGLFIGETSTNYISFGGSFSLDINSLLAMLFLPVTYLIVKYKNYSWRYLTIIGTAILIPTLLTMMFQNINGALVFMFVALLLLIKAIFEKRMKISVFKLLLAFCSFIFFVTILFVILNPVSLQRLAEFVNSDMTEVVEDAVYTEKFSVASSIIKNSPMIANSANSNYDLQIFDGESGWEFVSLLACHGWVAGLFLLGGQIILIITAYRMSHQIKNSYAKYLSFAIASFFGVSLVIAIAQTYNLIPFTGKQMPLMGTASANIIDHGLVGMLICFYVKKDKITTKIELDVDYDSTTHILDVFLKELEQEYVLTSDDNIKRRKQIQKSIHEIKKDTDNWEHRRISHSDIVRKYGYYQNIVHPQVSRKELVFISYNQNDRNYAEFLSQAIEKYGYRCWYFHRDCKHGGYAEKIVKALRRTKIFIVVISANSNNANHVLNEVCLAFEEMKTGTIIMPLKIEDIELSDDMKYYLCRQEWNTAKSTKALDAFVNYVVRVLRVSEKIKN